MAAGASQTLSICTEAIVVQDGHERAAAGAVQNLSGSGARSSAAAIETLVETIPVQPHQIASPQAVCAVSGDFEAGSEASLVAAVVAVDLWVTVVELAPVAETVLSGARVPFLTNAAIVVEICWGSISHQNTLKVDNALKGKEDNAL